MKILIVGGEGTVGKAIVKELSSRHTILVAGRRSALAVDITNAASIESMYKKAGEIDAVIAAAGTVHFGSMLEMDASQYEIGLQSKLMGQVNLVLIGIKYLNEGGSFTLTSGTSAQDPYRGVRKGLRNRTA